MKGKPNRLIHEKSPYLLHHAYNPVDWYPWGEEAFEKARREDKPIFLSIGYLACHWCMVMERESFEDEEIAELLNRHFIPVKVDREERPDVDHFYMAACQAMTGGGGWPLTVFLTPEGEPFFAGTYFPKESRHNLPGLKDLLKRIAYLWENQKDLLLRTGGRVKEFLEKTPKASYAGAVTENLLRLAYENLSSQFDPHYGGFGKAPKFPITSHINFLLRWWKRSGEKLALTMVEKTLEGLSRGGIWDHIGFGFHRYSVDERWRIPHFEKMLYDQALLAIAFLETFQVTGNSFYATMASRIFEYALRDLRSPEGGFYSSESAESSGEEGGFYFWTREEVEAVLGKERGELFSSFYGISAQKSVPFIARSPQEFATERGLTLEELERFLEEGRQALFQARLQRPHPLKDEKILTDWNGLMIAALAMGGRILNDKIYTAAAVQAAEFLLREMRTSEGVLFHRFFDGESAIPAFLDDYAFLAWGLLELYGATFNHRYLEEALLLAEKMLELFRDPEGYGLLFSRVKDQALPLTMKAFHDGVVPSGNSVAALVLLRLSRITGKTELEREGWKILEGAAGLIGRAPSAYTSMLTAMDFALGPVKEIVVAAKSPQEAETFLRILSVRFLPEAIVLFWPGGPDRQNILKIAPWLEPLPLAEGQAIVYLCENYTCRLPIARPEELEKILGGNKL
ncbi:MAG: thioredoxin domain-containing protein [Anaerolineae bacterium]|nr:thioredoxin domain-containing protein [Anaerolineae bacterium]MDW8102601.1 thioredoxin domain-containing protein [Anaerolineae bacterium]